MPPGGPASVGVRNQSEQLATVAYDGVTLTIEVPAGFIPQVYLVQGVGGDVRCTPQDGQPQIVSCSVSSRPPKVLAFTAVAASAQSEAVALIPGCNTVTLTWPVGTPLGIVAAAVTPVGMLESIFKLDPILGRFRGFSPVAPTFVNDYTAVEGRREAVILCLREAGTLTRPVL